MIQSFDLHLPHGISWACRRAAAAEVVDSGGTAAGGPRVMLLHGFPEAAFVWDEVLELLAAAQPTMWAFAPNLRGYPGSSSPPEVEAYRARPLVQDLLAAIDATGGPLDLLVAHDWGGALAWNLAAQHPEKLKHLLILNSPHPATFLRELRHNPAQQAASAYMNFLCRPDAEQLLAANDYARLWPFFGSPAWMTPQIKAAYRAAWSHPAGGLTGPLNYYRASPLRPAMGPADTLHTLELPDRIVTVQVPTTVLWGDKDAALMPSLLDGLAQWVPDLQVQHLSAASHWLVHEQPRTVAQTILRLLPSE